MRTLAFCLLVAVTASWTGCATHRDTFDLESRDRVSYYDRNGDGIVDLEKHHYPGVSDADWELRDENYDGRYDKKILFGFTITEQVVDLPVPAHVPIQPNQ
jgi:hypothetical protein